MPELRITIPEALDQKIEAAKPEYLDRKGFLCLLIEQSLDTSCTLVKASPAPQEGGEAFASSNSSSNEEEFKQPLDKKAKKEKTKDPFAVRVISPDLVPADLLDCQQLLPEFWSVKKGVRSESVWNRICGRLRAWTPEQRRNALEASINAGWGDVYEPKGTTAAQDQGRAGQKPIAELAAEMDAMPSLW
jgi:hypothetical protein